MIKTNVPDLLWDFCITTESDIMSRMYIGKYIPGLELLTSDSVDIIE